MEEYEDLVGTKEEVMHGTRDRALCWLHEKTLHAGAGGSSSSSTTCATVPASSASTVAKRRPSSWQYTILETCQPKRPTPSTPACCRWLPHMHHVRRWEAVHRARYHGRGRTSQGNGLAADGLWSPPKDRRRRRTRSRKACPARHSQPRLRSKVSMPSGPRHYSPCWRSNSWWTPMPRPRATAALRGCLVPTD
jgi:hypothetical protein